MNDHGNRKMKINTLKRNKEFRFVYNRGSSYASKYLVLIYLKRNNGGTRPGFSVSKKIGGAVRRNKVRRQLKAAFYNISKNVVFGNFNIIFIARNAINDSSFFEIQKEMYGLLNRAKIISCRDKVEKDSSCSDRFL